MLHPEFRQVVEIIYALSGTPQHALGGPIFVRPVTCSDRAGPDNQGWLWKEDKGTLLVEGGEGMPGWPRNSSGMLSS